ncbi:hypothetical protein HK096_008081, partial [Nowakowskiella sp. JEL0078]
MDSFLWLLLLSLAMFIGSFLAGNIPLAFSLSESRLRVVSTFGAGLLVGTALTVILPEGVETLYTVQSSLLAKGFSSPNELRQELLHSRRSEEHQHSDSGSDSSILKNNDHKEKSFEPHRFIGTALTLGFAFMFLIDTFGESHQDSAPQHIQLSDFRESTVSLTRPADQKKMYATLGLIVHAAADGIAMGAASASDRASLELIVFAAIMLHKAPSAFGLSTFLLHERRTRRNIRSHLLVFSLAAPVAAIITYMVLKQAVFTEQDPEFGVTADSGGSETQALQMQIWTGVLLLFSAGTFLYVATMHILPEIYSKGSTSRDGAIEQLLGEGGHHSHAEKRLTWVQVVALCL